VGTRLNICAGQNSNTLKKDELALNNDMRDAWMEHAFWTNSYMTSLFNNLDNTGAVLNRLLQTAEDIADVYAQFYSQSMVNQLTGLLEDHIKLAGDYMAALQDDETMRAEQIDKEWYRNADKIAELLSGANPKYEDEEVMKMLYTHLDLLKRQIKAALGMQYEEAIRLFDENVNHLMELADYLTQGLLEQFY
jgi:hypothetical protein